jgi:hypothetical protein
MKMQLTQNNFSIAKNPPANSAQPQRQDAIVDKSLEDFVQQASTKQPELAKAFNEVLEAMRAQRDGLKIDVLPVVSEEQLTEIGLNSAPEFINNTWLLRTLDRDGNKIRISVLTSNPQSLLTVLGRNLTFLKSGLPQESLLTVLRRNLAFLKSGLLQAICTLNKKLR